MIVGWSVVLNVGCWLSVVVTAGFSCRLTLEGLDWGRIGSDLCERSLSGFLVGKSGGQMLLWGPREQSRGLDKGGDVVICG